MNDHKIYMQRAIELAANVPDFPFCALIVDRDSGKILAEGWNKSAINPTFSEVMRRHLDPHSGKEN
ncbi:MAG: hypothetical protein NTU79_01445 [Planctomycetota bacterium]|nr:hypothetical protein [Planctomycetota bacterium]